MCGQREPQFAALARTGSNAIELNRFLIQKAQQVDIGPQTGQGPGRHARHRRYSSPARLDQCRSQERGLFQIT